MQARALEVLDWLFDDSDCNRAQGRTTVYAIALIRAALRQPGHPVEVCAHTYPDVRANRDVLWRIVRGMIDRDYIRVFMEFDPRRQYILSTSHSPVLNWIPDLGPPWTPPLLQRVTLQGFKLNESLGPRKTAWEMLLDDGGL
jgi:hypothetical protein